MRIQGKRNLYTLLEMKSTAATMGMSMEILKKTKKITTI
jgi:hypothetical protein